MVYVIPADTWYEITLTDVGFDSLCRTRPSEYGTGEKPITEPS